MNKDLQKILENHTFRGYLSQNECISLFTDEQNNFYAVKKIPYTDKEGKINFEFKREVELLGEAQQNHYPFVPLISFIEPTPEHDGYIITKYLEGGSLMHQINIQNQTSHEKESKEYTFFEYASTDLPFKLEDLPSSASSSSIFPIIDFKYNNSIKMINIYGVTAAVSILHKMNIFHRDIKPENILLDANCHPYLSDFGFARKVTGTQQLSGPKGTLPYMAPEIITQNQGSLQSDIFSLGVTMIMILQGQLTIIENNTKTNAYLINQMKLLSLLSKGKKYEIPSNIPAPLQDLIRQCIEFKPEDRPLINYILTQLESDPITQFGGQDYINYFTQMHKYL